LQEAAQRTEDHSSTEGWLSDNRALEDEITTLQAHINAAQARLLELLARVTSEETWGDHAGCLSASHWLQWRCGLTPSAARELVRLAAALKDLPEIKTAFSKGELTYAQVKALCSVATPETEAELLDLARHCTGGQLGRFLSGYRQALECEQIEAANESHRNRYLYRGFASDGSYRLSGRARGDGVARWRPGGLGTQDAPSVAPDPPGPGGSGPPLPLPGL
jgi:Domain of unknown function (DUF222)